jgi:hypothetical protein
VACSLLVAAKYDSATADFSAAVFEAKFREYLHRFRKR